MECIIIHTWVTKEPKDVFQGREISPARKFHSALLLAPPRYLSGGTVPARNKNALQNILWLFFIREKCSLCFQIMEEMRWNWWKFIHFLI